MLRKFATCYKLGLSNLFHVFFYRLKVKQGHFISKMPINMIKEKEFFAIPNGNLKKIESLYFYHFSWFEETIEKTPDWFMNPITGKRIKNTKVHWSKLSDFDTGIGDIKTVWELSRFDWTVVQTRKYLETNNPEYINILNLWISDWCEKNPVNQGPNWKCAQEASIRVMNLLLSAYLLKQLNTPKKGFITLIEEHCKRIYPTTSYAKAQDNNHGTSEAVALYIAGLWLHEIGKNAGKKYFVKGKKLLENRVKKLIAQDGSFSQYSVNYHRLMLDTICLAEIFRKIFFDKSFSKTFYRKTEAVTLWLYAMTNPINGNVPILGANDGSRLFQLVESDYRDYRPTVQLASALFLNKIANYPDYSNTHLFYFNLNPKNKLAERETKDFSDGGFSFLKSDNSGFTLFFKYPQYKFRPSHCDALHVDLWDEGTNILCDAGSYSYNTDPVSQAYFPGTKAHNTIQFDNREQMPRISRFLLGSWLKTKWKTELDDGKDIVTISAGYKDYCGSCHKREVKLADSKVIIIDQISNFKNKAVLRWRLFPASWHLSDNAITDGIYKIQVKGNFESIYLTDGELSHYYMKRGKIPVLEVLILEPGKIKTVIQKIEN